ncbi:hypothetical protein ACS0TY_028296 [Phlomoides rotata]
MCSTNYQTPPQINYNANNYCSRVVQLQFPPPFCCGVSLLLTDYLQHRIDLIRFSIYLELKENI